MNPKPDPVELLPIRFPVNRKAKQHPFVLEARVVAKGLKPGKNKSNAGVVGTQDIQKAELYGWINPVMPHIDTNCDDHWIYGLLISGSCELWTLDQNTKKHSKVKLFPGSVFRLNDEIPHWTQGRGISVCIYSGCYPEPSDTEAVTRLSRGLNRLKNGVHTAPRVREGFRFLFPDEVIATNDFETAHHVPKKLAEKREWIIQRCGQCDNPAIRLDDHWPWYHDQNRCVNHLSKEEKAA